MRSALCEVVAKGCCCEFHVLRTSRSTEYSIEQNPTKQPRADESQEAVDDQTRGCAQLPYFAWAKRASYFKPRRKFCATR